MTTFTARYGFPQINVATDDVIVATDFNTPWANVDIYLGTQICTSATRPSVPVQGQLIYETDTLVVRVWSGTAWEDAGIATCLSSAFPVNPITGDVAYATDKKALVAYNGTAWYFTTVVVCTSTTRPTVGLVSGVAIWETDTLAYAEYTGSGWRYTSELSCTSSTRPTSGNTALVAGTQAVETDTKRLLQWSGSAWQQVNTIICTSSTHPTVPISGGEIFETDTGLNAVYNGSVYLYAVSQVAPSQILVATTASVTFTGLPAVTRLGVYWRARGSASGGQMINMQFDANTGSVYQWVRMASASAAASATHSGGAVAQIQIGVIDGTTASYFASGQQIIDGWNQATGFTTTTGTYCNLSTTTVDDGGSIGGQMNVVGPRSSIKFFPAANSFAAGSQFSLYGLM